MAIDVGALAARLADRRPAGGAFIVGITGAVAAGKSTLARQLSDVMASGARIEVVATDGFLFDNASLEAKGLLGRKGFPETYDMGALRAALAAVRRGAADFPAYSHLTYDIDPTLARRLDRPDILIVEGLGLHEGAAAVGLDLLIYLDADEAHLETWFAERFLGFWRAAKTEPASFYARFRHMSEAEVRAFAGVVWREVNLPNYRQHIVRARDVADIVVAKGPDHAIVSIKPA
jgi:type I pantothenate kinase